MYDLETEKVVDLIKKQKVKSMCIQLPDGLKPNAENIQKEIEKNTSAEVFIWMGSCFGSCDYPDLTKQKIDLLIQWGHSRWQ